MQRIQHYLQTFWKTTFIFTCVIACCVANIVSVSPASAISCNDVQFIFARGSGEKLSDVSFTAWHDGIIEALGTTTLHYDFYELGSQKLNGYQYPAVAVSGSLTGIGNLLGAAISGGSTFEFGRSVDQGTGELEAYLARTSALCPRTRYVLGGYSQGAMVLSRTLDKLDSDKIIYVTTFGDPKLYLPEGNNFTLGVLPKIPDACYGKDLSNYRLHVPDCFAYEGVLGSYRPYQTEQYIDKLGAWCNNSDIMCSSGVSISDHTSYVSSDLYRDAARVIAQKVKSYFTNRSFNASNPTTSNLAEVAILIDSTQSMAKMIDQYKAEAQHLATQVLANHGHVALYEFRDLQEGFTPQQHCDFTCTLATFSSELSSIKTYGGGDRPESALSASLTAMNSLKWSPGATKSIIILTDAPYLTPDRDGVTVEQVAQRSLEIDPVNIYVLTNRQDTAQSYQPLIEATNGRTFDFDTELELSTKAILGRPVAKLSLSKYVGAVGSSITFDASRSYVTDDSDLHFDWDLDGDGVFEYIDQGSRTSETYATACDHYIRVRVHTSPDNFSTMSAQVLIYAQDTLRLAEITQVSATQITPGNFEISFSTKHTDQILLIIDDAIQGFIPISNNTGKITVQDLIGTSNIHLIPYSNNLRGIAKAFTLDSAIPKVPNTAGNNHMNLPLYLNNGWEQYLNVLSYYPNAN